MTAQSQPVQAVDHHAVAVDLGPADSLLTIASVSTFADLPRPQPPPTSPPTLVQLACQLTI